MRLLYFHQHFSTREGSTGTRSYEFARRLVARGHRVTMVCGSAATGKTGLSGPFVQGIRRGRVDGIDVIEVEVPYSNRLGFVRRALAFLRFAYRSTRIALGEPCDLVFATSTPLTAALPGIAAASLRRRPFVFEVRDLWPELPKAMGVITNPIVLGAMSALEWLAYRSATACVALSPGIAEGIRRRSRPSTPVHVIPNGCDNDLFGTEMAAAWRPDQVGPGDLLAIFPGAHGIANGLDAVLDAAKVLLTRARHDVKILLVGDGMMKPHLVQRAKAEGLSNVVFLDPVTKMRLAGLMQGADLGLMTLQNVPAFYRGTSPNKFFDFIAAGKPVLNNYPGWLADMISTRGCGLVVPPDDPEAFADALEYAATHRDMVVRMGRAAQQLAREEFDRDLLANRFCGVLESVGPVGARHAR
jgi:glycosyltransferase involved in cell wall biosynthesis